MAAASLPSLLFCVFEIALWIHGISTRNPLVFHLPPESGWDRLFAAQSAVYGWVARWNAPATLAATAFVVSVLARPRWRPWAALALIPFALLLCADFTLRWRTALLP